jgi:hypothetical protein
MVGARRLISLTGWVLYGIGVIVWIVGYYIPGHHSLLAWASFSPPWISMFMLNLECEMGLLLTILGTVVVYASKAVPKDETSAA